VTEKAESEFVSQITSCRARSRAIFDSLRLHYWIKNVLLFVPAVLEHRLEKALLCDLAIGFIAFGFAASANYLLNDYIDRENDRGKQRRTVASTATSLTVTAMLGISLSGLAVLCALQLPAAFRWILLTYCIGGVVYSLFLKRFILIDLAVLVGLHVLRITAGEAIISMPVSSQAMLLFGFAFLALASFKRMTQLISLKGHPIGQLPGRTYQTKQLNLLSVVALTASVLSLMVLAFMLRELQAAPSQSIWVWLIWPVVAGWFVRLFVFARRGQIGEDMMAFVLTDTFSLVSLGVLAAIYTVAQ
jgi:4-hydroxybenzoate polyprenyltransferase